jgi:peptidyl-prolyl cis-trans isomerase SurA
MRSRLRFLLCLMLVPLAGLCQRPAAAQDSLRIVAVVNDDVITAVDLATRMRMIMASSGLQDTPEARQRLLPQVLRALIDDRLRNQAASKEGVTVSQDRIDQRIDQLAKSNNASRAEFASMLERNGIQLDALEDQIRTEIAWAMLIQRKFRQGIIITDSDVDAAQKRMLENQGKPEYQVAEIFLAVDDPAQSDSVKQSADRLLEQLKGGADFAALARQFSQSSSAANGGLIGWVHPGDLAPEIDAALTTMEPGTVAGPVRSEGGYHVLLLRNKRTTGAVAADGTVSLKRIVLPLQSGATPAEVDAATRKAEAMVARISACDDVAKVASDADGSKLNDLANVRVTSLPPAIQTFAINQPIGKASEPTRGDDGIGVFVVCQRNITAGSGPTREQIGEQLMRDRLDLLARSYLRDLRRAAYVDIRR